MRQVEWHRKFRVGLVSLVQFFEPVHGSSSFAIPQARIRHSVTVHATSVLPLIERATLERCVSDLEFPVLLSCMKDEILKLGDGAYAVGSEAAERLARQRGLLLVGRMDRTMLHETISRIWGGKLCEEATLGLERRSTVLSAKRRFTPGQFAVGASFASCLLALGLFEIGITAACISAFFALLFIAVVVLRLVILISPETEAKLATKNLREERLPVYSVLVPLYREPKVLPRLLTCLANFDYPHDKLDIKIIVEQHDEVTRTALAAFELPPHFQVIVVPPGSPQTKPRALNYAMLFARGELLTIYDAEDIPSPRQLRCAAERFAEAPEWLACLQARLAIYNRNENWLTRQFALEYAVLFFSILPSLAAMDMPIPLGGTSNHFRVKALQHAGCWDPFNVTEDADLGMRLSRLGYSVGVLDSDTFEEACLTRKAWTRQRARWLKGFLQTWLVHMRQPLRCWRELGNAGFLVLQTTTLAVFVSALFHPITLIYMGWELANSLQSERSLLQSGTWLSGLGLAIFVAGYGAAMLIAARAVPRQRLTGAWKMVLTMPVYWMLMMPAAWLALYQFVTDVHGWNKTEHGLSKLLQQN